MKWKRTCAGWLLVPSFWVFILIYLMMRRTMNTTANWFGRVEQVYVFAHGYTQRKYWNLWKINSVFLKFTIVAYSIHTFRMNLQWKRNIVPCSMEQKLEVAWTIKSDQELIGLTLDRDVASFLLAYFCGCTQATSNDDTYILIIYAIFIFGSYKYRWSVPM